ncbi:hypothetical protein GDO86_009807 [Hymenochirus boettgeri]|uniref:Centrosomal protein of 162 kDa n=1 Tax=Hymenochirus boettgeri TaxID=247094 RepID=A0A8T2JQE3_9PIPI|nr:hypothetical protein GDO86_009807 [Hymenochirus boettgeri]
MNKKGKKRESSPWWITEDDSDDNNVIEPALSFIKSKRSSQPIKEEEEDHIDGTLHSSQNHVSVSVDRDSLEVDESVVASGPNHTSYAAGLDTLEEKEEKERFFARLENGASSTIDYSRLNKELDSEESTQLTALTRNNREPDCKQDENKSESRDYSENYSEDFDDDDGDYNHPKSPERKDKDAIVNNSIIRNASKNPGMLAKVMLLDSLDSTLNTTQKNCQEVGTHISQGTSEVMGTGVSNIYSNSDVEALQMAYTHIQSMEDTDEQRSDNKAMEHTGTAFEDTPHLHDKSLQKISTAESDIPTVDELMQPIRVDSLTGHGACKLKPSSQIMTTDYHNLQCNESTSKKMDQSPEMEKLDHFHEQNTEKKSNTSLTLEIDMDHLDGQKSAGDKTISHRVHSTQYDEKINQASPKPFHHINDVGTLYSKKINKEISPTSLHKKPYNSQYDHVRSSGYGKSSPLPKKPFLAVNFSLKKSPEKTKDKSAFDMRNKGILSATRTIRFADSDIVSEHSRTDSTVQQHPKSSSQMDVDKMVLAYEKNDSSRNLYRENLQPDSTKISGGELSMLLKLESIEHILNSDHTHSKLLKEEFSKKEEDILQKLEDFKKENELELGHLKQENWVLQTKLSTMEDKSLKKVYLDGQKNTVTDERMQLMQKEIEDQETLLQGYQQENERLYKQVKDLQIKNKQNEEIMFQENQSLKASLISLREQLNKATIHQQLPQHDSEKRKDGSELLAEVYTLQKRETCLLAEISRHKQDKQSLELDLAQMRKERDHVKTQLAYITGDKSYEMKIMEENYKQEIDLLNKKLKWFAENQELLDKDAGRLKEASQQIKTLTLQIEKLRNERGNQYEQQQKRFKERAADVKRIQDLERQVKEMEGIIRRRHPNSIPALILAAAAAPEPDENNSAKSNTIAFLEKRVKKLETDLENKDEDAKKSLRSMEQQFQKVKIQYESQINKLEVLLANKNINEPQKQYFNTEKGIEDDHAICKETYQATILYLQKEIEQLKERNLVLENKEKLNKENLSCINKPTEEKALIAELNQDLLSKSIEIQELTKTVERLQKERMILLSVKSSTKKTNQKSCSNEVISGIPNIFKETETVHFPGTLDEKLYQPGTFADFHISDIQRENTELKAEVKRLCSQISEQKEKFQVLLSQADHSIQRLKEEATEKTAALKHLHQKEMENIICQHAVEHSASKVAELSNKISTQEILIKHLQKQVHELQKDKESLGIFRIREETLQMEVGKLLKELKEAKEYHSPEMKHFLALENKIKNMEIRHLQKEQELQQIIQQTRLVAATEQIQKVDKWKKLAEEKNLELEKFRTELDSMLDVLRILQKQGVVIPTSTSENIATGVFQKV